MKSALKQPNVKSHLKLVKNNTKTTTSLKTKINRVYINTLTPGFNYINHVNKLVTKKYYCALL
jgi:hypothetical protein